MMSNDVFIRRKTRKLDITLEKQANNEKSISYYLRSLKRAFESGEFQEDFVENADETHFVFNIYNGRTDGLKGDEHVKYADVVSQEERMTMMVRGIGGRHASVQPLRLVFKNEETSDPISGVPDSVPGVYYCSGKNGWMDNQIFKEWLSELRAFRAHEHGHKRVLYVDSCSGHNGMRRLTVA